MRIAWTAEKMTLMIVLLSVALVYMLGGSMAVMTYLVEFGLMLLGMAVLSMPFLVIGRLSKNRRS